jgi:hypothetical protein
MGKASISIIHYPVYDKNRDIIATSVTNLEIHDIARTCMTFGIELCYIVTPLVKQREIAEKLIDHWRNGYGAQYNPVRSKALSRVRIKESVSEMIEEVSLQGNPIIIGTSSKERKGKAMGHKELHRFIEEDTRPALLLFGTGWGLSDETVDLCDKMLVPIKGSGDYNHLSLRVALGIVLDRIFGERGGSNERDS